MGEWLPGIGLPCSPWWRRQQAPPHVSIERRTVSSRILHSCMRFLVGALVFVSPAAFAIQTISDANFAVEVGDFGQISSIRIVGDAFPTNYVMNATNSPDQNTADHQWMGELMFKYRKGAGTTWDSAYTSRSPNGRTITKNSATKVSVRYANATGAGSIRDFAVDATYELKGGALVWSITVNNTSNETMELGDFGLPMPFNERWPNETIYETRTTKHSFVGLNGSYITAKRPSGIGHFLMLTPDATTGAKLEYMDHWRQEDHPGSTWVQGGRNWVAGLNVYYVHSNVIKSTGRGYLPNSSLTLAPGASKTYAFKFHKPASEAELRDILYREGMVDVNVAPGMIVSKGDAVLVDLHTSKTIGAIEFQHPATSSSRYVSTVATDHKVHEFAFTRLGENIATVHYGNGEKIALQFWVIENPGDAVQRHATFMVEKTQIHSPGAFNDKIFDDWMMDTKSRRNAFTGHQGFTYWMGWGDDWGYTHAQFLAEKNAMMPVASEIKALDDYLEVAVWGSIMKDNHTDFRLHNWLSVPGFTDDYTRGYAYPHVYNTFFSMYKIAKLHPEVATLRNSALTYLKRAYGVMNSLYAFRNNYNFDTGLMGELTTPEIIAALEAEGLTAEAAKIRGYMATKWNNFKGQAYPYGSEYNYDNTGEEAVYTLAKMNNNTVIQSKINDKTRACRGWQPVWYYYGVPVTICGENWWQFQYTVALAGAAMDDWMRYHSKTPDLDARTVYPAKLGNFTAINSGQISADPANIGTVSWTYQASKGNLGATGSAEAEGAKNLRTELHNGWRSMAGEADLGLFGALKIISSDVAQDPVFGLVGYGCVASRTGSVYTVSPRDGIGQRINVLPLRLYLSVQQDQITNAVVSKDIVQLVVKSRKPGAHANKVSIEGLSAGSYTVSVDGVETGKVNVVAGKTLDVPFAMNASDSTEIVIKSPISGAIPRHGDRGISVVRDGGAYKLRCGPPERGEENATLVLRDASGIELARLTRPFETAISWTPSRRGFVVASLEGGKTRRGIGSFMAW
jgi:hypothetical protein